MVLKRYLLPALVFVLAACSSHQQSGGLIPQAFVQPQWAHHSGTACVVDPKSVGPFSGSPLNAVLDGASETDAWNIQSGGAGLQFNHFTGTGWHVTPTPTIPYQSAYSVIDLLHIDAIQPNDVWLSGYGALPDETTVAFFLHWDGSTWAYVPNAPALTHPYHILALAGSAPNNIYAIAAVWNIVSTPSIELERWNGEHWYPVGTYSNSNGIANLDGSVSTQGGDRLLVFGANDVWMSIKLTNGLAIVHWNGSAFITTPLPAQNGAVPAYGTIGGTADDDIWFIGSGEIAHHDTSWARYNNALAGVNCCIDVVDFRPGYAVMPAEVPPGLLVYNGYVRWRPTSNPFPVNLNQLTDAHRVPGTTSFWIGQFYAAISSFQAAVELVKCPSTPPAPL